jgi:hypothetical protein
MKRSALTLISVLLLPLFAASQGNPGFNGKWSLIPQESHDIGLFANLSIDFQQGPSSVTLIHKWGSGRSYTDSLSLQTGGAVTTMKIRDRVWPANVFMGLSRPVGGKREFKAMWGGGGKTLTVTESYSIQGSQGLSPVESQPGDSRF